MVPFHVQRFRRLPTQHMPDAIRSSVVQINIYNASTMVREDRHNIHEKEFVTYVSVWSDFRTGVYKNVSVAALNARRPSALSANVDSTNDRGERFPR